MSRHLIHCVLASSARNELPLSQLTAQLALWRKKNQRLGITGVLLYAEGNFFQVLEGEYDVVEDLAAKIARDPRHTNVTRVISEPIPHRVFNDWSMGFLSLSAGHLDQLGGVAGFFASASCLAELRQGRARKLLTAFCQGRWRVSVPSSHQRIFTGV